MLVSPEEFFRVFAFRAHKIDSLANDVPCAFGPSINNSFVHSARHNLRYLSPLRARSSAEFIVPKSVRCVSNRFPHLLPSITVDALTKEIREVPGYKHERQKIWNVTNVFN